MKYKILIVSANYYKDISKNLIRDAESTLDKANIKHEIIFVPGVFEIPVTIAKKIKKYNGFVALGCVIKGETPHFDFISKSSIDGIMNLSISYKKPIGNGILTCLNKSQAVKRSEIKGSKRKGREAAKAVISVLKSK
jgi:6,7-dimethyl-8-ribityllumazine synthase